MISATIITGFLGSGKTTLLNRLLKSSLASNSLVLINEFGETAIDDLVVTVPAENMRLLANGCMCCQTKGELVDALMDVSIKRACGNLPSFERLLIETSGLADPVPIVHAIANDERLSNVYRLDRIVTVVDAVHVYWQLREYAEARKQVALADILLLSKTDLVDPSELPEIRAALARLCPSAEVLAAAQGAVDSQWLLGASTPRTFLDMERWLARAGGAGAQHADHLHTDGITTFAVSLDAPVGETGLATWLSMLASFKGAQLLRVKGIVNVAGEPHMIDAVQSVVHAPVRLDRWPTFDRRTRMVFIVRGLRRETVEQTFSAFAMGETLPSTREFDPAAYARFRKVADEFIDLRDVTGPPQAGAR